MKISEGQLMVLSKYYNHYDPFLEKKEAIVDDDGIKVLSIESVYHPDENQYMPEEVLEPLEVWYARYEKELSEWKCVSADDLPF